MAKQNDQLKEPDLTPKKGQVLGVLKIKVTEKRLGADGNRPTDVKP